MRGGRDAALAAHAMPMATSNRTPQCMPDTRPLPLLVTVLKKPSLKSRSEKSAACAAVNDRCRILRTIHTSEREFLAADGVVVGIGGGILIEEVF